MHPLARRQIHPKKCRQQPCRSHPSLVHGLLLFSRNSVARFGPWALPAFLSSSCAKVRHVERARRKDELHAVGSISSVASLPQALSSTECVSSRVEESRLQVPRPRALQKTQPA